MARLGAAGGGGGPGLVQRPAQCGGEGDAAAAARGSRDHCRDGGRGRGCCSTAQQRGWDPGSGTSRGRGRVPSIPHTRAPQQGWSCRAGEGPESQARGTWDRVLSELLNRVGRGQQTGGVGIRGGARRVRKGRGWRAPRSAPGAAVPAAARGAAARAAAAGRGGGCGAGSWGRGGPGRRLAGKAGGGAGRGGAAAAGAGPGGGARSRIAPGRQGQGVGGPGWRRTSRTCRAPRRADSRR